MIGLWRPEGGAFRRSPDELPSDVRVQVAQQSQLHRHIARLVVEPAIRLHVFDDPLAVLHVLAVGGEDHLVAVRHLHGLAVDDELELGVDAQASDLAARLGLVQRVAALGLGLAGMVMSAGADRLLGEEHGALHAARASAAMSWSDPRRIAALARSVMMTS